MKANELMVGDWVFVPHNGSATHYGRVCGIYEGGAVSNTLEKDSGLTKASALNPIHITPEILEKNGFVPDNFSPYYLPIEDGSIRFSKHQYGLYCNILLPYQRYDGVCNYVHQLQHALRLCGIEKEIVI